MRFGFCFAPKMGCCRLDNLVRNVAEYVREGRLKIVLAYAEHPSLPAHMLAPQDRMSVPKVRAFVDFAVPRLRSELARLAAEAGTLG